MAASLLSRFVSPGDRASDKRFVYDLTKKAIYFINSQGELWSVTSTTEAVKFETPLPAIRAVMITGYRFDHHSFAPNLHLLTVARDQPPSTSDQLRLTSTVADVISNSYSDDVGLTYNGGIHLVYGKPLVKRAKWEKSTIISIAGSRSELHYVAADGSVVKLSPTTSPVCLGDYFHQLAEAATRVYDVGSGVGSGVTRIVTINGDLWECNGVKHPLRLIDLPGPVEVVSGCMCCLVDGRVFDFGSEVAEEVKLPEGEMGVYAMKLDDRKYVILTAEDQIHYIMDK